MVTTCIIVVGSERVNSTPKEFFENLILLQIVCKYIYRAIYSIKVIW